MPDDKYYFDTDAADRVCRFFETQLIHFEGRHAGKPFTLLPWQRKILRDIFGWKRTADNTRRYRVVYIEIPRKQGKSAFCSGLALYLLVADNEPAAQVYSAACNTEQSRITFDAAKKFVASSRALSKRISEYRYHLAAGNSIYKVLSGEAVGAHGKNIHGLIIDELHEWTSPGSRDLHEALTTSMGARTQPLTVYITTAGHGSDVTLCREQHDKATRYLTGEIEPGDAEYDDTYYPTIFAADPKAAWDSPETWATANPSLGHTVPVSYLQAECIKAKESPAKQNSFLRLYLNIWTEQQTRWLDMTTWDKCTGKIDADALEGQPAYVSMDLSQTYDLTAVVTVFPQADKWLIVPTIYMPQETARRRSREEGIPFTEWIDQGYIISTPGQTVDYDRVEADILDLTTHYEVIELAYDSYNANQIVSHLEQAGITTVSVPQNYLNMSAACKEIERRLLNGTIVLQDNPAFRWTAGNVEVESDRHGNIRPVKPRQRGRYAGTKQFNIDPIVAAIMATNRAMLRDSQEVEEFDATSAISFV